MAVSSLTLLRSSTIYVPSLTSYKMILQVTSSQGITQNVFVKQRLKTTSNGINDVFAAIATPEQLESLGVGAPTADTRYFLDSTITLTATTVEYLNEVLQEILSELQSLVIDVELIDSTAQNAVFTITSGDVTVNNYVNYTLYRLPMAALACGTITVTDGISTMSNVNTALQGWLPTNGFDPAGYYWKYNIATDTSLNLIFPPSTDKLELCNVTKNGITLDDGAVLITQNGIYWNTNNYEECPWPSDFQSPSVPGGNTPATAVVLVLAIAV